MYQKQIAEDHESFLIINDKLKESFKEEKTERNQIFNEEIEKIKSQSYKYQQKRHKTIKRK